MTLVRFVIVSIPPLIVPSAPFLSYCHSLDKLNSESTSLKNQGKNETRGQRLSLKQFRHLLFFSEGQCQEAGGRQVHKQRPPQKAEKGASSPSPIICLPNSFMWTRVMSSILYKRLYFCSCQNSMCLLPPSRVFHP